MLASDSKRDFARLVVRRLRDAGYVALWAGGCVRDQILGKQPKDYDVATSATPDEVIHLFGRRNTVAVGAAFGVVMVVGPKKSDGQVEVATFRSDGEYSDGRRPDSVRFCSPEEDALRRDFTINGMFFDPITEEVLDYVGGRDDLTSGVVRAIGNPIDRFTEDKLRMIRAVRFAATFGFRLEDETHAAIRQLKHGIHQVSVERIVAEMRRMFAHPTRRHSLDLLIESGLLEEILPQVFALQSQHLLSGSLTAAFEHLQSDQFEPSMALLLQALEVNGPTVRDRIQPICDLLVELKMSNSERQCISWIVSSLHDLSGIPQKPLHQIRVLLADEHSALLLDTANALEKTGRRPPGDVEFCRRFLSEHPADTLTPPPLITGQDILATGMASGRRVGELLEIIRREQLDNVLITRDAALIRLRELSGSSR